MIKAILVFVALLDLGTPADIAAGSMLASVAYAIPSEVMGGYLASGHPGARYSGRSGDPSIGGTHGPYRLHAMWARRYGGPRAMLKHRVLSSLVAGHMLSHARRRHYDGEEGRHPCAGVHDWRAHPKASPGARDSRAARSKVWRQMRVERGLCGVWCRIAGILP